MWGKCFALCTHPGLILSHRYFNDNGFQLPNHIASWVHLVRLGEKVSNASIFSWMVFYLLLVYQEGQQYRLILNCASLILISVSLLPMQALPVHPGIKENQDACCRHIGWYNTSQTILAEEWKTSYISSIAESPHPNSNWLSVFLAGSKSNWILKFFPGISLTFSAALHCLYHLCLSSRVGYREYAMKFKFSNYVPWSIEWKRISCFIASSNNDRLVPSGAV